MQLLTNYTAYIQYEINIFRKLHFLYVSVFLNSLNDHYLDKTFINVVVKKENCKPMEIDIARGWKSFDKHTDNSHI
jgi:hypothetical protein